MGWVFQLLDFVEVFYENPECVMSSIKSFDSRPLLLAKSPVPRWQSPIYVLISLFHGAALVEALAQVTHLETIQN